MINYVALGFTLVMANLIGGLLFMTIFMSNWVIDKVTKKSLEISMNMMKVIEKEFEKLENQEEA